MTRAIVGTGVNVVVAIAAFSTGRYPGGLCFFMLACTLVSAVGIALSYVGNRGGAVLVMLAALPFVPIGSIAFFGGNAMRRATKESAYA
ncbi:MAG: hypothetical protein KC776_16640 [Myxococcales bacterium]|nr:hypothetical protein [Myxococcales bacterium]MCB9575562.1 hypothetical protein [Polyangiaceae bacterium]